MQRDDIPGLPFAGMWDVPGGGSEVGETPFETIQREVYEELHIMLDEKSIVYQKEYLFTNEKNTSVYFMAATLTKDQVDTIVFGDEGQGWKFTTLKNLLDNELVVSFIRSRFIDLLEDPSSDYLRLH